MVLLVAQQDQEAEHVGDERVGPADLPLLQVLELGWGSGEDNQE